jgi:hypothetical protein
VDVLWEASGYMDMSCILTVAAAAISGKPAPFFSEETIPPTDLESSEDFNDSASTEGRRR